MNLCFGTSFNERSRVCLECREYVKCDRMTRKWKNDLESKLAKTLGGCPSA